MTKRRYDERVLGPKRVTAAAWYSLPAVTRDRINVDLSRLESDRAQANVVAIVRPGVTFIGEVQDALRAAGRRAAASRFMVAMQQAHDAQEAELERAAAIQQQPPQTPQATFSFSS